MKLLQGDCLSLMKDIPDKSVDLVVTDPPYDIHASNGGGCFGDRTVYSEVNPISTGFNEKVLDELCRVMKKINCYFFCSQKQILPLINYFLAKDCNWTLLTWHKTNPVPTCNNKYLNDTEYCLFFREKGVPLFGSYETKRTYWTTQINARDKNDYGHPTIKPVEILRNLILNSTERGMVVLDPFMGSGSTGVACRSLNRDFIGIELDPNYYEIAKKRINAYRSLF